MKKKMLISSLNNREVVQTWSSPIKKIQCLKKRKFLNLSEDLEHLLKSLTIIICGGEEEEDKTTH